MEASTMMGRRAGSRPVGDRRTSRSRGRDAGSNGNVNAVERVISAALGSTLLLRGVRRRSLGGVLTAVVGSELLYRGVSGTCPVYKTLGIRTTRRAWDDAGAPPRSHEVERSITIGRSASDLYRLWREPGAMATVFSDFAQVTPMGGGRMHWSIQGPMGRRMDWDSIALDDRPGESFGWKSVPGAKLPNEGSITFRPATGGGTAATLRFRFDPPGGVIGDMVTKMLGYVPEVVAMKALRRFKSLAETGEVPNTEHNPSARAMAHAR